MRLAATFVPAPPWSTRQESPAGPTQQLVRSSSNYCIPPHASPEIQSRIGANAAILNAINAVQLQRASLGGRAGRQKFILLVKSHPRPCISKGCAHVLLRGWFLQFSRYYPSIITPTGTRVGCTALARFPARLLLISFRRQGANEQIQ